MLKIEAETTRDAIAFVKNNLDLLGVLKEVEHTRNLNEYITTIKGQYHSMVIDGGLGSGYEGEGPRGLANVLLHLGVSKDKIQDQVYGNSGDKHQFKIKLS